MTITLEQQIAAVREASEATTVTRAAELRAALATLEGLRWRPIEGTWRFGECDDPGNVHDGLRAFIEADKCKHDSRLYVDGDFADRESRRAFLEGIAARLNALPALPEVK